MGKIKGWKKKNGYYEHVGNGKHHAISFTHIQVKDGKDAFLYKAVMKRWQLNAWGEKRLTDVVVAQGTDDEKVFKKTLNYMRSHPNG